MTDTRRTPESATQDQYGGRRQPERTGWVGWVMFASVMLLLVGTFQVIAGLSALFNDEYYLVTSSDLVVSLDFTVWGWTHLLLGILVASAGLGLAAGQMWARVVGVVVVALSAILNIGFLAANPVWCAIMIAIDVLVIWALIVHGQETKGGY